MASSSERFKNLNFHKSTREILNEFRCSGRLCDFNVPVSKLFDSLEMNFKIDGQVVPAHYVVLSKRVPFFKRIAVGETAAMEALSQVSSD